MNTPQIYQHVRLSRNLHGALYRARRASDRHCADALERWRVGGQPRLRTVVDVAARGTLTSVLGFPSGNTIQAPTDSASFVHVALYSSAKKSGWAPFALQFPYATPFVLELVAAFGLPAANFVVGTGAYDFETKNLPPVYNAAETFQRYGLLGLPEAALVRAAEKLSERKQPAAAAACRIGAICCAVPLEVARVAIWLVATVSVLPLLLVLTALHVAYAAVRHAINPSVNPVDYLWHMTAAKQFREYESYERSIREAFEVATTDHRQITQRALLLTGKMQRSLGMISGIVQATSAAQARNELLRVCESRQTISGAPVALEKKIELLQETCEELCVIQRRNQPTFRVYSDSLVLEHLFLRQDGEGQARNMNVWQTKMFHKASLRLHPDKVNRGPSPLPGGSQQFARAAFDLVTVLRDLYQITPACTVRSLHSASQVAASRLAIMPADRR